MSNLTFIKPKTHTIQIGKETLELKFTLKSFAYLEEEFGSVVEAVKLFNEKDETTIKKMLEAGSLHTKFEQDFAIIEITDEIISTIANAMGDSISQDYNFSEEIDWPLLYYIIKPALNMSEIEFWSSTHKQMLGFLKMLEKCKEQSNKIQDQKQAVEALMGW